MNNVRRVLSDGLGGLVDVPGSRMSLVFSYVLC
jgi:hypothetical protein